MRAIVALVCRRLMSLMNDAATNQSELDDVTADAAKAPFVLTLDVGTSSVRAMLFDALARGIRGMAVAVQQEMRTTSDGGVEADADSMVDLTLVAVDRLLASAGLHARHIGAVAVDTFWHSLLGVDDRGRAVTPVYTWADTRAAAAAEQLKAELDEEAVHARTGCMLHSTYPPAKLRWIAGSQQPIFRKTATWMAFGDYLYLRLFGYAASTHSMASGSGLFDQHRCCWDQEVLQAVGLTEGQLPVLIDRQDALRTLLPVFARRWPMLAGIPWFPAVADGAANNVGSGCRTADRVVVMVGTSGAMRVVWPAEHVRIPRGLWVYRLDRSHFAMGGVLSTGGNMAAWMRDTLRLDDLGAAEHELEAMAPDGHGLTILPFLAGERSTGWAAHASAVFAGVTLHTRPIDLLRAGMESVALRFAELWSILLRELPAAGGGDGAGGAADTHVQVVASGAALAHSPVWIQMIADALGCPVARSSVPEATSRGVALLALEALGVTSTLATVTTTLEPSLQPSSEHHQVYQRALIRQKWLYDAVIASREK